jgi:homocitrate synthase NifV
MMIENKLGKKRDWIIPQMEKVFHFARKEGATISFGAEDASRTDPAFLLNIFKTAEQLGTQRVRFADTLGIMSPSNVSTLITYLSSELTVPIDFHGHNDFGMATANALCAWENGADIISCSALGLGERAGNTSLEEFVGIMKYLKGNYPDFDFIRLKKLCEQIASWLENPIPACKPLIGERIYSHESGIHVDGILKKASTYEFFPPELIGESRKLVLGKHSGKKAVHYFAQQSGFDMTDAQIDEFLSDMRKKMAHKRGVNSNGLFQNYLNKNNLKINASFRIPEFPGSNS